MKRSDVIRTIQYQFKHMRSADAMSMLDCVVDEMKASVAKGDRIEIRGFGTFQTRVRSSKNGYNPSTGEMIYLGANKTILFRPSRELTKKMNG